HHENEIAQSECASGKEFAHYWMHNAFLNIDNKKMSKSLGNFFTVRDISEKYDLQVLRLFMLSAHYRSPLNFSAELMTAAENSLDRIRRAADRLKDLTAANAGRPSADGDEAVIAEIRGFVDKFDERMDDDANTADALSVVFDLVRYANINVTEESSAEVTKAALNTLVMLCDILGINALKKEEVLDADIEALIAERQAARKARNFARADEIRDQLKDMGIVLMDTKDGVKWSRK
ncbi:MAG TPA: cysteine--tRNA ligase, partial [Lachnospiraceae bacterium]|nr:cysteine--tRNA ligase [Lachnospiraceae bacterium]